MRLVLLHGLMNLLTRSVHRTNSRGALENVSVMGAGAHTQLIAKGTLVQGEV